MSSNVNGVEIDGVSVPISYAPLSDKPSVNGVELAGNKTAAQLGLVPDSDYDPDAKTGAMTQPVGKDANGKLWTAPGGGGGAVSSVNGQTGAVVLTAADVGAGTYSKPSGGIPASDLASAVQTSLGKADTALQSVPSTYRTAAAQDTIDAGKIDKPSSPASGAFLVWNGSAWVAQTLATWQASSY